jgi:PEP-CTERM motif
MKKQLLTAAIALTSLASFSTGHAQSFSQTNAALGDLILGFETTGGGSATNLLVDLGSTANIAALETLNFNLGSDLTTVFGSNWSNTVSYGFYSVNSSKQIYAGSANGQGYLQAGSGTQGVQKTAFSNLLQVFNNNGVSGQTTTDGVIETASTTYSWSYFTPGNGAFGNANYTSIESPIGSSQEIFKMLPSNTGGLGADTGLGFTVLSTGQVAATPEPATYALFGIGALLLVIAYRRRLQA